MDLDDDLNPTLSKYPAKKQKKRVVRKNANDLGKLHALLTRGLPEFVQDGVLDVRKLATEIGDGISYQAIYAWFERERLSFRRVQQICQMSRATEPRFRPAPKFVDGNLVEWQPVVMEDFIEFMG